MRPQLKPALRLLWRDPATLQLGIDPRYAVALGGIDVGDAGLLELLDGTRGTAELLDEATHRGHRIERVRELLAALEDAAALDDASATDEPRAGTDPGDPRHHPDLLSLSLAHPEPGAAQRVMRARTRAVVEVLGAGRVGASLALLLAAAGVGQLILGDQGPQQPADFAPGGVRGPGPHQASRADAVHAALGGDARRRTRHSARSEAPAIVVLAPTGCMVPPEWLRQVRNRTHLPVTIRETTAIIGPLVVPGRTPCLRCVELLRGDRDPVWPALAAQLVGARPETEPCDIALASAAASIVALHVLAWLDRRGAQPPPSVGGVLELSLSDLRLRRRTIVAHPGCGCGAIDA